MKSHEKFAGKFSLTCEDDEKMRKSEKFSVSFNAHLINDDITHF
jgi:hypothetical protein